MEIRHPGSSDIQFANIWWLMDIFENNNTFVNDTPEHLLNKSEHNRTLSLRLARWVVIAKYISETADLPCISKIVNWCENNQMVINGRSRKEFADVLKNRIPKEEEQK